MRAFGRDQCLSLSWWCPSVGSWTGVSLQGLRSPRRWCPAAVRTSEDGNERRRTASKPRRAWSVHWNVGPRPRDTPAWYDSLSFPAARKGLDVC